MTEKRVAIAGAGLSGAVIANRLAERGGYTIDIFETRNHVAGNCYTYRDPGSGVMIHEYGPHIFHTKRRDVCDFVCRFVTMGPYTNRVKAHTNRGVFSLPINLLTINQFFGKSFSPNEARAFLETIGDHTIKDPQNFEEQALKFVGRDLYETFFKGYTIKQWGVDPKELPASILQRLPIRFNYDDNYYMDPYQGIPVEGYTTMIEKMIDHPAIKLHLRTRFEPVMASDYAHAFYSGPIDGFFNHQLGRLNYRTIYFERFETEGDYQGNAVINYCDSSVPHTRISEHKHFAPWENHERTVCFREFSKQTEPGDTPYYPMRLEQDKQLLSKYQALAAELKNVSFIGRLGTYRYMDMDACIGEALDLVRDWQ